MKDYQGSCGFHLRYLEGTDVFRIKSIGRKIVPRNGKRKAILMGGKSLKSRAFLLPCSQFPRSFSPFGINWFELGFCLL